MSTHRRTRRKRIRWSRMILVLVILALIVGGVIFVITSCNTDTYSSESSFEKYAKKYFDELGGDQQLGKTDESFNYGKVKSTGMQIPDMNNSSMNEKIKASIKESRDAFDKEHNADADKGQGKYALLIGYESYKTGQKVSGVTIHADQRAEKDGKMVTESSKVYTYNFSDESGMALMPIQIFNSDYREGVSKLADSWLKDKYSDELTDKYKDAISKDAENFNTFVMTEDSVIFYLDAGTVLPASKGVVSMELSNDELKGIKRDEVNLRAIDPSKPMVAMTFDDGPGAETSDRILDCYEKYGAVATFFEVGSSIANVKGADKILQRELDLGCEVGTHLYDHPNLFTLSDSAIANERDKTNKLIKKAIGQNPTVFRPPYGNINDKIGKIVDLPAILWSVDTLDWKSRNADSVVNVIKSEKNLDGKVILMHSIYDSSAEATERIVPWILDKGYQLVTVTELLTYRYNEEPVNGKVYGYDYFYLDEK